jgi:hypothetical protein
LASLAAARAASGHACSRGTSKAQIFMYAAGCCLRTFSIAAAPCFLKSAASVSRKSLLNDRRVPSKDPPGFPRWHCFLPWRGHSAPESCLRVGLAACRPRRARRRHQVCGTRTAQNRSTASATALATVALRAGDESTCSSARLTIIPASKSTAGIRDSYSTARLS